LAQAAASLAARTTGESLFSAEIANGKPLAKLSGPCQDPLMQGPIRHHLPAIDGLRAVAVIAVLLYHLRPGLLPGGFVGVDIFFVISGFVVSLSIPPGEIRGIGGLLRFFYGRRVVRILPALLICIFTTTLLCDLVLPAFWLNHKIEASGEAAMLGYSNFVLASDDGSYFNPRAEFNPFTQTWSLAVEEQFYLIFPLLFLPFLLGRRMLSRALFMAASAASLATAVLWSETQEHDAFYLIFARLWELSLGVLAFQLAQPSATARPVRELRMFHALSLLCAGVVLYGLIATAPERTPFPGSVMPCLATALLLWLIRADQHARVLDRALTRPSMRYLGRISYSLYLWHWPVFVLIRWSVGLDGLAAFIVAPASALGIAALSSRYIETPPRRALASGRLTPRFALLAGAVVIAVSYPVERSLWPLRSVLSLSVVVRNKGDWYPILSSGRDQPVCHEQATDDPSLGLSVTQFHRVGCPVTSTPPRRLFVVGDSHAGAYMTMIGLYVRETGADARLYQEGGCAVLGVKPNDAALCRHFADAALHDVAVRAHPGDILFLPGLRVRRLSDQFVRFGEALANAEMRDEAPWRAADLAATIPKLALLLQYGMTIIVEAPKPVMRGPNFRCADWYTSGNPICANADAIPRAAIDTLRAPVLAELRALRQALPQVRVWDPLPVLCPGETCYANQAGRPLFFDADHPSAYANRILAPSFITFASGTGPAGL
jgi:peptidoglycan/LPS O-acetylase OafA/YrhL